MAAADNMSYTYVTIPTEILPIPTRFVLIRFHRFGMTPCRRREK